MALTGLNSLEVKAEVMRLLGDNCDQAITARDLRDALITVFQNATGTVSPVYMKELVSDFDEMGMDLLNHSLQVTMEDQQKELKIFDEDLNVWRDVFSEQRIKEWIAASAKFEGVVAENFHNHGTGVKELSELLAMMGSMTASEILLMTGHYYTWSGSDGYIISSTDLGGELDGVIMQTNDWIQMINSGGNITDPSDPNYATQKPEFHLVHIAGDNLSKNRADGLYSFDMWHHAAYEKGSVVTYMGRAYKATSAVILVDDSPTSIGSKWVEIDFSGVTSMIYFGSGGFEHDATIFDAQNNWGMPVDTHPNPQVRQIHDGDRYVDLLTGQEVTFTLDFTTHRVTAAHTFGHTRIFELVVTADSGKGFEVLENMPRDTSDITITVEAIEPDGATYVMRYLSSDGTPPLLTPIATNSHNGTISGFGVLDFASKDYVMGTSSSNTDTTYRIIVHSKYHDISGIKIGAGVNDSASFPQIVDGSYDYPVTMKRNIVTQNRLPTPNAPDYIGQVHYDRDTTSGYGMLSAFALTTASWLSTVIGDTKVGTTGGTQAKGILIMTQAQYDAIATKDSKTLYFIEGI